MIKRLLFVLCALTFVFSVYAQSYSSDVELLETKKQTVVVRSSGIHVKKKDAQEMAVKSAFYTYFTLGVPGINGDKPLLGKDVVSRYPDYMHRFFEDGRYNNFVRSVTPLGDPERLRSKDYKVTVKLEFLNEALYADLLYNKIIEKSADKTTLEETAEQIDLPTIMVVPYRKNGETFADILQGDVDKRVAVTAVQKGFVEKGVSTVDFETKYRAIQRSALYETGTATSLDKELLQNSGADVYVEVDLEKDVTASGSRVILNLKANETASGINLAAETYSSNRFRTTATDRLCYYAVKDVLGNFLKEISTAMAKKIDKGNTIVLHVAIAEGATMDMDAEVGDDGFPLSDVLRMWVKKNAKNGKFHVQGSNREKIVFDQLQIQNKGSEGDMMDANDFALSLFTYLKRKGIACEKKVDGSTVYITIVQ